jgi:hypothetical protein
MKNNKTIEKTIEKIIEKTIEMMENNFALSGLRFL